MIIPLKYELAFYKKGEMVYISHLDLMTLFRRAVRRTDVPFHITKGFTPRVKISLPNALKLGLESENEVVSLWLDQRMAVDDLMNAINDELPGGVQITGVKEG
jgi:radical SAM-linked protein